MCDYKNIYEPKYECSHPDYGPGKNEEKTFCIFHNDREDKDVDKFYTEFKKLYKSGKHDFRGFIFPVGFNFWKLREETESLRFVDADFTEARFLCNVILSGSEFSGDGGTDFSRAQFTGKEGTDFSGAKFSGKGETNFFKAKFSGEGGTSFSRAKFSGEGRTNFSRAKFSGEGRTDFSWAQFSGDGGTRFIEVKFTSKEITSFNWAKFSGEGWTDFSRAQFSGEGGTYFGMAQFTGKEGTDFSEAQFSGECGTYFSDTQFSGEGGTYFSDAQFSGEGGTHFWGTHFSGEGDIRFYGRTFYDDNQTDFRSVYFKHPENLTFDGVDLGRCRFLWTDLSEIKFTKVYWCGRRFRSSSYFGRIRVFDERLQERGRLLRWPALLIQKIGIWNIPLKFLELFRPKSPPPVKKRIRMYFRDLYFQLLTFLRVAASEKEKNHYEVHRLYNQLIDNYEETNRYHEAGDFFAGMMEMRRRESFEKIRIRIALWFYRLFSLYGERPAFALGWLLILWLSFGFVFLGNGLVKNDESVNLKITSESSVVTIDKPGTKHKPDIQRSIFEFKEPGFRGDYRTATHVSLSNLTLGRVKTPYKLYETPWGPYLQGIETILGAVFVSLFVLAMNRKFRRTKD